MKTRELKPEEKKMSFKNATFARYHGKAVVLLSVSEYWGEARVRYVHPEGNQPSGSIRVSLSVLKEF